SKAAELASGAGLELRAVTVEQSYPGEPPLVSARSERLGTQVAACFDNGASRSRPANGNNPFQVRHGDIVEEILAEAAQVSADILVTGFHSGGPPLVANASSVSRQLLHCASCALLTVPL
ncbi:MAG: universal stress protein, partial [Gemmatimonadota bacterium]